MSAEANVLHAIVEEDEQRAADLLDEFTATELAELREQADLLSQLCDEALERKRS